MADQMTRIADAVRALQHGLSSEGQSGFDALIRELNGLAINLDNGTDRPCPEAHSRLLMALRLMKDPDTDVWAMLDEWRKALRERDDAGAIQ